jgi:hypothetical protein
VRKTVLLPTATLRCARGANCVSYPALGEPSKLSRGNPGPMCFACEKRHKYFEVDAAAAKLKASKRRRERATTERAVAAAAGHPHAEVSRASAIRERRKVSVLTCERALQSAIVSGDARLTRKWSRSLRDAKARLLWAESDLEASERRELRRSRGRRTTRPETTGVMSPIHPPA